MFNTHCKENFRRHRFGRGNIWSMIIKGWTWCSIDSITKYQARGKVSGDIMFSGKIRWSFSTGRSQWGGFSLEILKDDCEMFIIDNYNL